MDFSIPDMAFDANELSLLMGAYSPTRAEDSATLCGPGPDTNLEWAEHGARLEPCLDADTHWSTSSYKELLKLSLELVEYREILDTQAPLAARPSNPPLTCSSTVQHRSVSSVLNQTARFWDIVKALSSNSTESQGNGTNSSSGNSAGSSASLFDLNGNGDLDSSFSASSSSPAPPSAARPQDHLLMIHLVTTYVNLLRNCRAFFTRLHQALEVPPQSGSSAMLSLPNLQFGDFQLENNVSIQVKVLIELTTGMLQHIGNALGISMGTDSGISLSPGDHNYRLPFLNDPVAVSTREIILSQESMQGGVHGGEPPLMDIIKNLKQLLENR